MKYEYKRTYERRNNSVTSEALHCLAQILGMDEQRKKIIKQQLKCYEYKQTAPYTYTIIPFKGWIQVGQFSYDKTAEIVVTSKKDNEGWFERSVEWNPKKLEQLAAESLIRNKIEFPWCLNAEEYKTKFYK